MASINRAGENSISQNYLLSIPSIPALLIPSRASLDQTLTHTFPAAIHTPNRTRVASYATTGTLSSIKAQTPLVWKVMTVVTDVSHLRSFSKGIYIPIDFHELWHVATEHWKPFWTFRPFPSKSVQYYMLYCAHKFLCIAIDLNARGMQTIMIEQGTTVRSNDCNRKAKVFFRFPKDKDLDLEWQDDTIGIGIPRYNFIIKNQNLLTPSEELINSTIYAGMLGSHPFSTVTAEVSQVI